MAPSSSGNSTANRSVTERLELCMLMAFRFMDGGVPRLGELPGLRMRYPID